MMISKAMTFYDVTQAVMGNLHTIFFNFMTAAFPPMVSRVWRARGEPVLQAPGTPLSINGVGLP